MSEAAKKSTKNEHSIRIASQKTGIAIETLRVWERRYGVPNPSRKEDSNRRLYSDADIEKLILVAEALTRGFRPGDVIHKSVEEIQSLLPKDQKNLEPAIPKIREASGLDVLLALLRKEDIEALQEKLHSSASVLGPKRFLSEVSQPLLRETGDLWARGDISIRQEHLLSECLTTEIRIALSSIDIASHSPSILLATLPKEQHSLGIEMVALFLAANKAKPRFVGPNTPPEQIVDGVKTLRADIVGLTVTEASDIALTQKYISSMLRDLPRRVQIWIGGDGARKINIKDDGVRFLFSWDDIEKALADFRAVL